MYDDKNLMNMKILYRERWSLKFYEYAKAYHDS